jgi:hypothetical protein
MDKIIAVYMIMTKIKVLIKVKIKHVFNVFGMIIMQKFIFKTLNVGHVIN